jgi:starch synthase (maltosyl-transferring)
MVPVRAIVWRDGHDAVNATLAVSGPGTRLLRIQMKPGWAEDEFHAAFTPTSQGCWTFRIEGWSDPIATWKWAVRAKLDAGQSAAELANDLEIGARLFEKAARGVPKADRPPLQAVAAALRSPHELPERVEPAFTSEVSELLYAHPLRELTTRGKTRSVWVDRKKALFGAWYELFPRSTGGWDSEGKPVHGTFATAEADLPRIADMGFDVVYVPPIHPIGKINRKGPNNTLVAGPDDVGSPWAVGSLEGGHDAIHPRLGTLADFKRFVRAAEKLGMEVAIDFALQCAPDHPWAAEHPEWFHVQPDGTIAYAENPPKKYQDIYPLNFDTDPKGLYAEVLRVMRHWIKAGVKIFRVDNPHTKPAQFWEWLIDEVKKTDPDVLFLAEAFSRPNVLYGLARIGFSQSYTYFTWRGSKGEIEELGHDMVAHADAFRPNLFTNTPDILTDQLQHGGPGMFSLRAALAATLAPTWGIYSGFEIYEHQAVRQGSEEYLDSEKYQLRPRDFAGAAARGESMAPWAAKLNAIRRRHPALQQLRNLHFHHVDNEALVAYSKFDPATGDAVLVVVNLNPFGAEAGTLWIDMPAIGRDWSEQMPVVEEVTGAPWTWKQENYVKLEPWNAVAHIVALPTVPFPNRIDMAYRGGS